VNASLLRAPKKRSSKQEEKRDEYVQENGGGSGLGLPDSGGWYAGTGEQQWQWQRASFRSTDS
jgi:hypothetical protein